MKFETARQIQDALETIRKHEILIDTIGRIAEDSRKILADLEHRLNKLEAKKTLTLKP